MSSSLFIRFQLLVFSNRARVLLTHSKPQLSSQQQHHVIRSFSTSSLDEEQSFRVSYLVHTCGLSPEIATNVSKKVLFKTPQNPDSVIGLLKKYGFSNTHIANLVKQLPRVLVANSEKTLMPKFEFLNSVGISSNDLVKLVTLNPSFLTSSLENRIIPFYNFLRDVVCCDADDKVSKTFIRLGGLAYKDVHTNFAPNIAVLRKHGVPNSSILTIILSVYSVVFRDQNEFEKKLKEVLNMGYDPNSTQFIRAMSLFFSLSKSTRDRKMEIYKKWGWSKNEIDHAVRNYPIFLILSENKINSTMNFLVNEMGYQSEDIARYPSLLSYHLEKRIVPRCLVMKILSLKGLLKKDFSIATVTTYSEAQFLDKFVTKYHEDVPRLLDIYKGQISLLELGFSSEEVRVGKALQHVNTSKSTC